MRRKNRVGNIKMDYVELYTDLKIKGNRNNPAEI